MTRKQALAEYSSIVAQIELLKLKLPPLERILLQTEWKDWTAPSREYKEPKHNPRWNRNPTRGADVLDALTKAKKPITCMDLAKQTNSRVDLVRSQLYRLMKEGKAKSIEGDPFILYEAA